MTTLLDAYALVAYLGDEPCAIEVEALLRRGAAISALNLAEAIDRMRRVHEITADVGVDIDALVAGGLQVLAVDAAVGARAGHLRAARYHRTTMPVSMADCVAAATALEHGLPLATSDAPLTTLVASEGGSVIPLPDSNGERPG